MAVRHHGSDLEVMPRESLVIGGGYFGPERQLLPVPEGIPDASRPREVLRGRQVVGAEGRAGGCQVDGHVPDLGGNVEVEAVELGQGAILDALYELNELSLAADGVGGIAFEPVDDLVQ